MTFSPVVRRGALVVLVAYTALLAVALLAPSSGTQSGMASWVVDLGRAVGFSDELATQARAEFLCNALILAPVSALGSLLWPRSRWTAWTAWVFVAALGVEAVQGLFLPDRTASMVDVVANTLGGLLGAVAVDVVRPLLARPAQARPAGQPPGQPPAKGGRNSTVDPGSTST